MPAALVAKQNEVLAQHAHRLGRALVGQLVGQRHRMRKVLVTVQLNQPLVFGAGFALAGAESDQITIDDVFVPDELVVRPDAAPGQQLDGVQSAGFLWFELLMSASYLGAASALVERVLLNERIPEVDRVRLASAAT